MGTVWLPPARVLLGAHDAFGSQYTGQQLYPPFEDGITQVQLPALMGPRPPQKKLFTCTYDDCGKTFTVNGNLKVSCCYCIVTLLFSLAGQTVHLPTIET